MNQDTREQWTRGAWGFGALCITAWPACYVRCGESSVVYGRTEELIFSCVAFIWPRQRALEFAESHPRRCGSRLVRAYCSLILLLKLRNCQTARNCTAQHCSSLTQSVVMTHCGLRGLVHVASLNVPGGLRSGCQQAMPHHFSASRCPSVRPSVRDCVKKCKTKEKIM